MARVQHLPTSVQVELFFVLLKVFGILNRLLGKDGLSLVDLTFAEQFVDLLLWIFLAENNHLRLHRALGIFGVLGQKNHFVVPRNVY